MNLIKEMLVDLEFQMYKSNEKVSSYIHPSDEAKVERFANLCNRLINIIG